MIMLLMMIQLSFPSIDFLSQHKEKDFKYFYEFKTVLRRKCKKQVEARELTVGS